MEHASRSASFRGGAEGATPHPESSRREAVPPGRRWLAILSCLAPLAGILWLDLAMPRGLAAGGLYAGVVLNTIWARNARITVGFAVLASLLVAAGLGQATSEAPVWLALTNRGISVGLIWLAGAVVVSRLVTTSRFRMALEAAPAGMIVVGRRGDVAFGNGEAERLFGATPGGLRGLPAARLLSAESVDLGALLGPGRQGSRAALRRSGVPFEALRLDGSTFEAECDLRTVEREVGLVLITVRDTTQERRWRTVDERLAAIVRSSRDAIYAKDLDGTITAWNPGAEAMYGWSEQEALGRNVTFLVPPSRRAEVDDILASVRAGRDVVRHTRRVTKAGRTIEVEMSVSAIRDRAGRVVGASVSGRDRTQEEEAERSLLELNTALRHAMPGTIEVDASGCVETANPAALELIGLTAEELRGRPWQDIVAAADRNAVDACGALFAEGNRNLTARARGAEERFLELFLVRRQGGDGHSPAFHIFLRDVSLQARAEARARALAEELATANRVLERQANVDPLTGILNRRGLERRIQRLRAGTRVAGETTAVVVLDLDDFKAINDLHGHGAGDRVLVQVAEHLEEAARVSDPVARIGGDEFLVLLPDADLREAGRVAERLRAAVADAAVSTPEGELRVTCSIGVAVLVTRDVSIEAGLAAARHELARSKHEGKDRVCLPERERMEVRSPAEPDGLRAFHQPIYDLLARRIIGYELLVRGPEGPHEAPDQLFSRAGLGEDRTRLDLRCLAVCSQAARELPPAACLHVNLFPATLLDAGAPAVLERLALSGPDRIVCVELNEREVKGGSDELREAVRALKRAGVQIAIDDVGYGHTALEALLDLEPDVIKIDRRCVVSGDGERVLARLLRVARVLGARAIAEGVENDETLRRLRDHDVHFGQGYLWGRPAPMPAVPARAGDVLWPQPRLLSPRAPATSTEAGLHRSA
jgi:diguanylate cyclase (GGDEF)-like protein/PAS domain S-box-containing protein